MRLAVSRRRAYTNISDAINYSSMISLTYTLQVIYSLIFNQDYQENYRVKHEADSFIFTSFAEI